jgi:peptidoglycan hydrolase-like protein with peptidoglycan-binding domain
MRLAASAALLLGIALAPSALAAFTLGSRVLRQGMWGRDVRALQKLLTTDGFGTPASGRFSPATRQNVIEFQRVYGLAANGIVTKAVIAELRSVAAGTAAPVTGGISPSVKAASEPASNAPTLYEGATGRWVTVLQQDLTFAGFPTQVDGQFGPATAQTVIAFKQSKGLPANAVVGPNAWSALEAAVQTVQSTAPTAKARLNPDGLVTAPADAPTVVKEVIAAANQIATKPYCVGGGHGRWVDSCYDCSGSVGYALHGAGLLSVTEDSGQMESYGSPGYGRWITLFANAGHVYMLVAGLWFDTAAQDSNSLNDRWSTTRISPVSGFIVRHASGL